MGTVRCAFCDGSVQVGDDGSVEPQCPRCGAWVIRDGGGPGDGGQEWSGPLGQSMALESRATDGPAGAVRFVRAPYAGEPAPPWEA